VNKTTLYCPKCGNKLKIKYCSNSNRQCKEGHLFKFFTREKLLIMIECKSVYDEVW